ncbi:hypothetical protein LUZ60_009201 [Juncus effusus]|nr:hypothetical protein LUZ60_009201 [Juncus effusus]
MIRYNTFYIHGSNSTSHHRTAINACLSVNTQSDNHVKPPAKTKKTQPLLVERYRDGSTKRYLLDGNSELQTLLERDESQNKEQQKADNLSLIPNFVKEFVLPAGYPGSVSDDYLEYMLLQFPTNVTGWICHTLVTSSLLKAVGVGNFSGSSAAASAAAIRWVSKDGIGAIGRFLIGGRFGTLFDDDPKKWRMYADFIGSAGSIFELSTPLYPDYFLLLASVGNLAKAVARGLKDPSFRVIQNHFAVSSNLGEIAAKEEVWEVAAQIVGLILGILIMDTVGVKSSYSNFVFTWLSVRLFHLWLRYKSLSVLKFRTINLKRARILVKSHVLHGKIPGYIDCNKEENILSWDKFMQPRISFGVSIDTMIGHKKSSQMVKELLRIYEKEKYILFVDQNGSSSQRLSLFVTFKDGASSIEVLRSVWQAYWLDKHKLKEYTSISAIYSWIEESLLKLDEIFDEFFMILEESGWDKDLIIIKVPNQLVFEQYDSINL